MNLYLLEFSINSLLREKYKSIFTFVVLFLLISLLSSIVLIKSSLQKELSLTVDSLPSITMQKRVAGRAQNIEVSRIDDILQINGISSATQRVWGYYYFPSGNVNFTVVGISQYDEQYKNTIEKATSDFDFSTLENEAILGKGVKKLLGKYYYKDFFNFIKEDGSKIRVLYKGVFKENTSFESNDLILVNIALAKSIFSIEENMATDIIIQVANPLEIDTVALKLRAMYPGSLIITKKDIKISYENVFNYKGGLFLSLFIVSIFTFFLIIYDKSSSLSSSAKKEIGILKAIGWKIDDILKAKFYESFILSFCSFLFALIFSLFYVYILEAPIIKNIFIGYSDLKPDFTLPFYLPLDALALIFFLSIPIYIAASIFPSWRAAIIDADEAIR